jgi:hypothetical protein
VYDLTQGIFFLWSFWIHITREKKVGCTNEEEEEEQLTICFSAIFC